MPSVQAILGAIVAGASIATSVFLFAYFLGKLRGDIDRTRETTGEHASLLLSHGRRIEKTEEDVRDIWEDRRRVS